MSPSGGLDPLVIGNRDQQGVERKIKRIREGNPGLDRPARNYGFWSAEQTQALGLFQCQQEAANVSGEPLTLTVLTRRVLAARVVNSQD